MSFVYLERKTTNPNAPLLLLLHGYGSNEADLFSFTPYIPDDFYVISLQAPIAMGGVGFAWFPIHFTETMERWTNPEEVKKATTHIHDFLCYYQEKNELEKNPIYLLGFSQGAMLSYVYGLGNEKVRGIAALSGYLDSRVVEASNNSIKSIYVSHGTEDMVVPYAWAKLSVEKLKEYGFRPEFHTYSSGHGINQDNLDTIILWLQAQL